MQKADKKEVSWPKGGAGSDRIGSSPCVNLNTVVKFAGSPIKEIS